MKLFSTFAIGAFTIISVVSYPAGQMSQEKLLAQATTNHNLAAKEHTVKAAVNRKTYKKVAQVELKDVLNTLQANIALKQSTATANQQQPVAVQNNTERGLKKVEIESESSVTDYTIPSGDVFLDNAAVGDSRPPDDTVR